MTLTLAFLLHKRVNVVQESLNKCTSGVPRLFRRGNPDLEPEPENSTNLTEIMPITRLVEPLTIKTVKNDPIVNNDKQCIPMSSQVSINLFLPKLPLHQASVSDRNDVCVLYVPVLPASCSRALTRFHQGTSPSPRGICNVYRQEFNWLYTSPEGGGS